MHCSAPPRPEVNSVLPARVLAAAPSLLVILALSGCSFLWPCTDTTSERGEASVRVQVEDTSGQPHGVTAEVIDWRLAPHPQVVSEGLRHPRILEGRPPRLGARSQSVHHRPRRAGCPHWVTHLLNGKAAETT